MLGVSTNCKTTSTVSMCQGKVYSSLTVLRDPKYMQQARTSFGVRHGAMMRLKRISAQIRRSLEEFYTDLGAHPGCEAIAGQMLALIRHLEHAAPGPERWVTTSHYRFYMANEDTSLREKALVFIDFTRTAEEPGVLIYEIKYRSVQELPSVQVLDWEAYLASLTARDIEEAERLWDACFTTLNARDVEEAGRLVDFALQHAEMVITP